MKIRAMMLAMLMLPVFTIGAHAAKEFTAQELRHCKADCAYLKNKCFEKYAKHLKRTGERLGAETKCPEQEQSCIRGCESGRKPRLD